MKEIKGKGSMPLIVLLYLFKTQALLMHIAKVKHGLSIVLLLICQAIVSSCSLIVHLCPISVVVVVPKLHPSYGISLVDKYQCVLYIFSL